MKVKTFKLKDGVNSVSIYMRSFRRVWIRAHLKKIKVIVNKKEVTKFVKVKSHWRKIKVKSIKVRGIVS